ncbi:MAG: hypothetical protein M1837_003826 [Sclerophora amabilis]|nr:MAG: hypothetical protein M1837_003826 [Sclerophora amabilis]
MAGVVDHLSAGIRPADRVSPVEDESWLMATASRDRWLSSGPMAAKLEAIDEACQTQDFSKLVGLATSEHGLVNDEVRRRAWPILLGCADVPKQEAAASPSWRMLPEHRDEDQIRLDVDRSFIYYPHNPSAEELRSRKAELSELITQVLRRHPYLCYFQGYHDICQVFLLVLGADRSVRAVEHISLLRIRDYMLHSLSPALSHLHLLPSILHAEDPKLCEHLSQTQPFFALAATLTLYAHDIQEYGDIARLFDVLLAREAVFSVYLFAEIVLRRRDELFEIPPEEPEMLHSILCKLPKPLELEKLISQAVVLFEQHPPETLRMWRRISSYSVLKTARSSTQAAQQNLAEGSLYFQKQSSQLRRAELRQLTYDVIWRYRRPAGTVGLAVLVGVFSWWIRRNPNLALAARSEGLFSPLLQGMQRIYWGRR